MKETSQEQPDQKPYHHGHLRRSLLDAALQLVAEQGVSGLTLREVARRAGVSHAAPYHHFADKSSLIEALVIESFESLNQALREAEAQIAGTSFDRFIALGHAYIRFAAEHPMEFRIIFRPELVGNEEDAKRASTVVEQGQQAYQILVDAIVACQQDGYVVAGDPTQLALAAWSLVHGYATLLLDFPLRQMLDNDHKPQGGEQLADSMIQALAHGLLVQKK